MEESKVDKVIKALEALYDAMHKNQCYACSYEFVEVANEFGTEIIADAIETLKEQVRPKGSWDYGTECSICHKTIIPPKDRTVKVYFCPWCGADMRQWYGE